MSILSEKEAKVARKSTRHFIRRDMKAAQARLNKIEDYLARCGSLYEPDHKEIYAAFCACLSLTRMLKESLARIAQSI